MFQQLPRYLEGDAFLSFQGIVPLPPTIFMRFIAVADGERLKCLVETPGSGPRELVAVTTMDNCRTRELGLENHHDSLGVRPEWNVGVHPS
jgi:hypothetical protein